MRGSRSRQTDFAKKARSYGRSKSKNTPKAQPQASPTYGNNRVKTTPKAQPQASPTYGKNPVRAKPVVPTVSENTAMAEADTKALAEAKAQTSVIKAAAKKTSNTPKSLKPNPFGGTAMASIMSIVNPEERNKTLLGGYQNTLTSRDNFDKSIYDKEAAVGRDSLIRGDKYRNDEVSYNQAYWASRLESGKAAGNKNIQAEMAAEQKAIGSKKSYSGDRAITQQDQQKSKYILDALGKSGIKPTVTSKTSGFFDEMNTTTSSYDIGTGKPMTTTRQQYSPIAKTKWGNLRLGDDVTKTFVNGVAVYTQKNDDPATTSETGSLNQRSQSSPDPIKEMADIDNQIKTETDPAKLKALHKRRLMLMRMNRTNTRFAGLLGEADTKRTNLMSIS
jgi:hypothetical protein